MHPETKLELEQICQGLRAVADTKSAKKLKFSEMLNVVEANILAAIDREEELSFRAIDVNFTLNDAQFVHELKEAQSILRCSHYDTYGPIPCPFTCPRQSWPEHKFKKSFWTGKWKLRK
jgi:hypothetical protein